MNRIEILKNVLQEIFPGEFDLGNNYQRYSEQEIKDAMVDLGMPISSGGFNIHTKAFKRFFKESSVMTGFPVYELLPREVVRLHPEYKNIEKFLESDDFKNSEFYEKYYKMLVTFGREELKEFSQKLKVDNELFTSIMILTKRIRDIGGSTSEGPFILVR